MNKKELIELLQNIPDDSFLLATGEYSLGRNEIDSCDINLVRHGLQLPESRHQISLNINIDLLYVNTVNLIL
jgi:hypothetical protein